MKKLTNIKENKIMEKNLMPFTQFSSIVSHAQKNALLVTNVIEAQAYANLYMKQEKVVVKPPSATTLRKTKQTRTPASVKKEQPTVTCAEAILTVLQKATKPFTNSDIQERLEKTELKFTPTNISVNLLKLSGSGKIKREGETGKYIYSKVESVKV